MRTLVLLFYAIGFIASFAQISEYKSILREDRIWVNYYDYNNLLYDETTKDIATKPYSITYSYELSGDTVVNEKNYKKCYMRVGERCEFGIGSDVKGLTPVSPLPVALVREEGLLVLAKILNYPSEFVPDLFNHTDGSEYVTCDFNAYRTGEYNTETIEMDKQMYNLYYSQSSLMDMWLESVGKCSGYGTFLFPEWPVSNGMIMISSGLSHVLNSQGDIIYKSHKYRGTSSAVTDIIVTQATATDSRYYNLQGQAVDIKSAPAGIYIHNGKKIVVK